MKKLLFSLLLPCFTLINLLGQDQGLFWKIEKKKHKTSYLYGTMHLKDKRIFSFDSSVEKAIKEAKYFYSELDMQSIDHLAITKDMPLPSDTTLKDLYEDSTEYLTVRSFLDENFGHYGSLLYSIKPFYVEIFFADQFTQGDSPMALDEYLFGIATDAKVKTGGLETLQEQINTVNSIPLKTQAQDLLLIVEGYNETGIDSENNELLRAYLDQNLASIDKMINSYSSETALFKEKFLVERNKNMIKKLAPTLKKGSTFCAVGAGHLFGNYGLISLLKEEGFTLTPIPFSFDIKED